MNDLSEVLRPVATARGLPNAHYVDADVFEEEKRSVLFANWAALGFGKDVEKPGDALPVDFLGVPLLIVRDADMQVHVYQNTCRHRGMILVDEKKNIGRGVIRCPYHSWCYSQKGALVTTPHVGGPGQNTHPDVDRDTLGLIRIRSYLWHGIIFVNVLGNAPEFTDYAAGLIDRWSEFEDGTFQPGGAESSFEFDVACNWKLAVENFCESYHLPWVHPGLNSYSRLEDHYHIEAQGHYSGQGTTVYRPTLGEGGQNFPNAPGLSEKWDTGAEYVALYPNALLGVHRDHFFAMILLPKSLDQTVERTEIFYRPDAAEAAEFSDLRDRNRALWKSVLAEDVFVVEGLQRGRHGIHFDGGKFSPAMDGPTHCFHQWVASQLTGREPVQD